LLQNTRQPLRRRLSAIRSTVPSARVQESAPISATWQDRQAIGSHWLSRLARIRTGVGRAEHAKSGKAPHKPLLLLCVLDLIDSGKQSGRVLTLTPELVLRFRGFGSIVSERWSTKLSVRLPFYYLKNQGFWSAFQEDLKPATGPENCALCELHERFFELLQDADFRMKARMVLISQYFAPVEKVALFELLGIQGARARLIDAADQLAAKAIAEGKKIGRSARFQIRIVEDYRHTCALTGYRCFTTGGSSIVDAAHIDRWVDSQNDDLSNGLALSKSARWMFDQGLWSVDDRMRIIVAGGSKFTEHGPDFMMLRSIAGKHLQIDPCATLRPAKESLRIHRTRHGFNP
jgi:putative restriction endonuclease